MGIFSSLIGPPPSVTGGTEFDLWMSQFWDMGSDAFDEYIQDLVGAMFEDTASIDFTYTDTTGKVSATVLTTTVWQVNKDSVGSSETLTIASGYEIVFGEDFTVDGTVDNSGQLHIL